MSACCFAGSISNTPCLRSGMPYVLIMNPNSTTTATASGAIYIERFSHNSRHTDQRSGRVVFVASTSCRWIGTFSDGLFIGFLRPLTTDYGPQTFWGAYAPRVLAMAPSPWRTFALGFANVK